MRKDKKYLARPVMPRYKKYSEKWTEQKIEEAKASVCEHDKVGYKALEELADVCVWRSKQDRKVLKKYEDWIDRLIEERRSNEEFLLGVLEQNEEIWKERNNAILAYRALADTDKLATKLGIDIEAKSLPHHKKFSEDYEMFHAHKITEGGKERYKFVIRKKDKKTNVSGQDSKTEKSKN